MLVPGGAVNFLAQRCFSAGAIVNVEASVAALVAAAVIVPSSGMRAGDFGSVDMFASTSVRWSCTEFRDLFRHKRCRGSFHLEGQEQVRGGAGTRRRRYEGALMIRPFRIPGFDVDQVEQTVFTRTPRRSKLASSCSRDLQSRPSCRHGQCSHKKDTAALPPSRINRPKKIQTAQLASPTHGSRHLERLQCSARSSAPRPSARPAP